MKSDRSVPDWLLERLHRNELPETQAQALRQQLDEAGESGRLAALAASDREILESYPSDRVAAGIRERLEAKPAQADGWALLGGRLPRLALGAVGGLGVLMLIVQLGGPGAGEGPSAGPTGAPGGGVVVPGSPAGAEYIGLRGLAPHLVIYRKGPGLADRLSQDAVVRRGDELQIAYVAVGRRYGVIASVDARGAVTLHWPVRPGTAAVLSTDDETPLPTGFELDDSPGFEKFFFVAADEPFATTRVTETLSPSGLPPLPSVFSVSQVTLKKESP